MNMPKNKFLFTNYKKNKDIYVPVNFSDSFNFSAGINSIKSCYKTPHSKSLRTICSKGLECITFPDENSFIFLNSDGFDLLNYKLQIQKKYINTINKLSNYMKENFPNKHFDIISDSFNPIYDIIDNIYNFGNGIYNLDVADFIKMKKKTISDPKHIVPNGIFPFVPKIILLE